MNILRINDVIHPITWVMNFLSDEEICKILKHVEKINPDEAVIGQNIQKKNKKPFTPDYHIKNMDVGNVPRLRKTIIKWIELNLDTNWLYRKIILEINKQNQENFNYILRFVENLQFSEYNENQQGFYSEHYDCGDKKTIQNYIDIRKLSFSIQLDSPDDYEGGDLILYPKNYEKIIVPKEKGTIIFFESDILHEVTPVKKGIRRSLVSWVQGPNLR